MSFRLRRRERSAARTRSRPNVAIEGGADADGDRHVLIVDRDACTLYELFALERAAGAGTPARARSGTCARTRCGRAAGRRPTPPACRSCPASRATTRSRAGVIDHALRFTVQRTRRAYVYPARHFASERRPTPTLPPMGLRLRLQGELPDVAGFPPQARVVLARAEALRDDRRRQRLELVRHAARPTRAGTTTTCTPWAACKGSDFEVVDTSKLQALASSATSSAESSSSAVGDVLLEVGDRGRARDGNTTGERARSQARATCAGVASWALGDAAEAAARLRELAGREREPGDEGDPVALARLEHVLRVAVGRGCSGSGRRRSATIACALRELVDADVRDADVAHLALVPQLRSAPTRLLVRHVRVDRVELVEVDALDAQPAQALLARRASGARAGVAAPVARGRPRRSPPLVAITRSAGYGWSASAMRFSLTSGP